MPGTNQTPRSASVVSLHHDGLLCTPAPGLLQPGTDPGVHCVSAFPEPETGTTSPRKRESLGPHTLVLSGGFPATRFIPLDEFPSPAAAPHHCERFALLRLPLVPSRVPRPPKSAFRAAPQRPPTEAGSRLRRRPKPTPCGEPPREQSPYHRRSHGVSHHCVTSHLPTEAGKPRATERFT